MDPRKYKFIQAVLGDDGASALKKASERSREIESALLPRTIVAWLGIAGRSDYEGDVPGLENSYLQFSKAEGSFSGSISIDESVYSFEKASLLHLAAAIAVALGGDQGLNPRLKDLDIQRLGKNIDTLAKARVAVAELKKMRSEPHDLMKSITQINPGAPMAGKTNTYDYSHVLTPEHRAAGYALHVKHDPPSGTLKASLRHGPLEVGEAKGHTGDIDAGSLSIQDAEIPDPRHRGRGLGQHMYEALMAHGFHKLGLNNVSGSIHSTMASKVHQALSQKHGMGYKPTPTPAPQLADPKPGPYDARVGPYQYTIKDELPMGKGAMPAGPKGGAEAPGPQAEPRGPGEPVAPLEPQLKQTGKGPTIPMRPKPPKLPAPSSTIPVAGQVQEQRKPASPSLTVSKSQAALHCGMCNGVQFQHDKFIGCLCFRGLSKSVKTISAENGYKLEFGKEWDHDSLVTLAEAFEEK